MGKTKLKGKWDNYHIHIWHYPNHDCYKIFHKKWQQRIGRRYGDRKQQEKFAKELATNRALEIKNHGNQGSMSAEDRSEYWSAKKIVGKTPLVEAAKFWLKHHPKADDVLLHQAIDTYLSEHVSTLSDTTQKDKKSKLLRLKESLPNTSIREVSTARLEQYVNDVCPSSNDTRNNVIATLKAFFSWCANPKRNFLQIDPSTPLEKTKLKRKSPEFHPWQDVERLFHLAEEIDPDLISYLALGFFAGIRPNEIRRLKPTAIDRDNKRITVPLEAAKTRRSRTIEKIPDCIWEWLLIRENIDCANAIKRYQKLKANLGLRNINSGARHTFATYAFAYKGADNDVKKWLGHTSDNIIHDNYANGEAVQMDAIKYFQIKPKLTDHISRRRTKQTKLPPASEIIQMLRDGMTQTQVAEKYGVSQSAVYNALKRFSEQ